jgi:ribosomal protein L37AE/L43A
VNVEVEMARKKRCPNCGSKKARKKGTEWMCGTCGKTWSDKEKRSGSRKEKTRFSGG